MNDRIVRLMDLLATNKKIKVTLLAQMLNVTNVTLRRDLEQLEKRGIVSHSHGYASLDGANDTGKRIAIHHSIKKRIVKAASEIIEEGELILMESGSCCAMLVEELALLNKNISIATNSLFIVNYISNFKNIKTILLGGHLQTEAQVLVGSMTRNCAQQIYAQKLFLGVDGFIPEYGFAGSDRLRAETANEFVNYAEEVYVLTESEKFSRRGKYNLVQFDKLTGVFTDDGIPKESETILKKNNVNIHKLAV